MHGFNAILKWMNDNPPIVQFASAVLQVAGAVFIAWLLTERWQRKRQRRDFQQRLLGKFSELALELYKQQSRLFPKPSGGLSLAVWDAAYAEFLNGESLFSALQTEFIAGFGRQVRRRYRDVENTISYLSDASDPNSSKLVGQIHPNAISSIQIRLLAQIRLVETEMLCEMGLFRKSRLPHQQKRLDPKIRPTDELIRTWRKQRDALLVSPSIDATSA